MIRLEQSVHLAIWKDLNKGCILTKRTQKNQKIRLNYCNGEDGRAVAFFNVCLRAFGAQAVRMYCCCAYELLMICRIHQTPPSYKLYIPKIFSRYPQDIPKIYPRYTQDIPKISPTYTQDTPKINTKYPQISPRWSGLA